MQSNITTRIRRLEETLGQSIFERGRGGARLTGFGERLRFHADDLLARFDAAEKDLLDAAGASAPLAIGAMETSAAVRLPTVLKSLKQACPAAPISLRTGPTAELTALLLARKIDVAFVAGPIDETRFRGIGAYTEELTLIERKGGSDQSSLLAFRTGCSYRAVAESWLRDQGRADTDIMEMGSLDGILGCVEAGMGFAIIPKSVIHARPNQTVFQCQSLPPQFSHTQTHLVWRHDQRKTQAHEKLCSLIEQSG